MENRIKIFVPIIALVLVAGWAVYTLNSGPGLVGDVHEHMDFAVYLNGERYNFSQEKYMPEDGLSSFVHMHDMNGNVMHVHARDISLGFFFNTLGMKFNSTCFVVDDGTNYCNDGTRTLKLFVNRGSGWQQNFEYGSYMPRDEDMILTTYGNDSESVLKDQMDSVTDEACIYSEKCPERGKPPDEASCAGGCVA